MALGKLDPAQLRQERQRLAGSQRGGAPCCLQRTKHRRRVHDRSSPEAAIATIGNE
jgi:hypothetical protein